MSVNVSLQVLYGGTFDPVHNGHLAVARAARDALEARVSLMPAADPPHKSATGANAWQRAQMLRLAVAAEPGLAVDLRELRRAEPSYTVDTLRELRSEAGWRAPWAILLGADSFLGLAHWKHWRELFTLAHIVVAERPGSRLEEVSIAPLAAMLIGRMAEDAAALRRQPAGLVYRLRQRPSAESSSAIRAAIADGRPWRRWLPPATANFIIEQGLYRRSDQSLASAVD